MASERDIKEPKKQRGGDRGGRRPTIGKVRTVKMPDDMWAFCLSQPEGAGAFIRKIIAERMGR